MAITVTPITLADLTEAKVNGNGAFDTLMRAMVGHLELEFDKNRLRGADYANVYLNSLMPVLQNATNFLLQKDEAANRAALVDAQVRLTEAQIALAEKELEREELNKALIQAQTDKIRREIVTMDLSDAQITATTKNTGQEFNNLVAQKCLLDAQYDLTMVQKLQATAQTSLVEQKVATERAQTVGSGVEPDSIIGKQKNLYQMQADGFKRDAEQKAAKIMVDTWNVRRTTDVGTVADATNQLNDVSIGRVIASLMTGVGA